MRLSDEEIKDVLMPRDELVKSHIEANAKVRELEAEAQDWHERYVICCEDSRLEREALRNELIEANARVRELEANIDRWFRDHQKLSEAFIRQCDRADRLAVIADALAVESFGNPFWKGIFGCWRAMALQQQKRIDHFEAKLRELAEAAEWRDECVAAVAHCLYRRESCWKMVSVSIDPSGYRKRWEKAVDHAKMLAEAAEVAYQAAIGAAKEE
jgi:hypothetical protein